MGPGSMGGFDSKGDWPDYQFVPSPFISIKQLATLANFLSSTVYRTNTFPLIHASFFHMFMNILALTPLLERFEAEYGTLVTVGLFLGRMYQPEAIYCPSIYTSIDETLALSTIPALLYTLIERGLLRMNTTVLGARYFDRLWGQNHILTSGIAFGSSP